MSSLSTISIAVVSATFGAFIGYYIADKRLSSYYQEESEQEIEAMEKFYRTTYEVAESEASPEVDILVGSAEAKSSVPNVPLDRKKYKAYSSIADKYGTEEDPRGNPPDLDEPLIELPDIDYVDPEEFTGNENHYEDQQEFVYYPDAELLVDFWGERVTDPERYLGEEYLTRLPDMETAKADENVLEVFVMNNRLQSRIHIEVNIDDIPNGTFNKNEYYIHEHRAMIEGARKRILRREAGFPEETEEDPDTMQIIYPEGGEQ